MGKEERKWKRPLREVVVRLVRIIHMMNMDEDEYMRLISDQHYQCPYYRDGDDYRIVRHQM